MPTTIVTRAGKGSPLTNTEMDANFTNLKATADAAAVASETTTALAGKEAYGEYNAILTKTASHTLVLTDKGAMIEMDVASANTLTVPLNSSVAFPVRSRIDICQIGAGVTSIVATGGVTIRSKDSKLRINGQYSGAYLYKRGTDEWVLIGSLQT